MSNDPAIRLADVTRRYRGFVGLEGLELSVPPGCLYGLIGKSGAGKTTTLRILLGLMRATSGQASVLGVPSTQIAKLAGRIGATLDRPALFAHLTVRQHLELHGRAQGQGLGKAQVMSVLERLELEHLAHKRAAKLSAGERQRVSLARALVLHPEVLILDEPLVHLDPHTAHLVLEVLREEVDRGATAFLSSHQLAYVERVADRLAVLDRGRLVLEGTTAELLASSERWLRLRATPVERAFELLRGHALVEDVERGSAEGELRVRLSAGKPEEINAVLHEAGMQVSLLVPGSSSLDELFRRTVDSSSNGRVAEVAR